MFGAVPTSFEGQKMGGGVIPTAQWNAHIQVFEQAQFEVLRSKVAECLAQKVPVIVPMQLKVLANKNQVSPARPSALRAGARIAGAA